MSGLLSHRQDPFLFLFPPVVALLGFVLSVHAWPGINAALRVIAQWQEKQSELGSSRAELDGYRVTPKSSGKDANRSGSDKEQLRQGTVFANHAPWIFATAWCYFGTLPFYLYLRS